jgi:uncharacterized protein
MRIIVDSNVLFSALIPSHNPPHTIYQAWRQGLFELVTCKEQIDEIRRPIRYDKFKEILHPHEVGLMLNNINRKHGFCKLHPGLLINNIISAIKQ